MPVTPLKFQREIKRQGALNFRLLTFQLQYQQYSLSPLICITGSSFQQEK